MDATKYVITTAAIDATGRRDVTAVDAPGAFLKAPMDEDVTLVLNGLLVTVMKSVDPKLYAKYMLRGRKGEEKLYVKIDRDLYGCLLKNKKNRKIKRFKSLSLYSTFFRRPLPFGRGCFRRRCGYPTPRIYSRDLL